MSVELKAVAKIMHGAEPLSERLKECILRYIDIASRKLFHVKTNFYRNMLRRWVKSKFRHDEDSSYHIKNIKLPILDEDAEELFFSVIFNDTFYSYYYMGDEYSEKIYDRFDTFTPEGLYGLVNDKVNVTVEFGDVVVDAGSWIGDFAAYASAKGALTYAFEPTESTFEILKRTAELNGNIIPVKLGLSDENTSMSFYEKQSGASGSNSFMNKPSYGFYTEASVPVVRLDDFVNENKLERVDFIKSDIEGFERKLLAGAQETLRRFAPKLALCTYHLPDDPEVMASLILQANPKYNIVQKRKKLFASVPK